MGNGSEAPHGSNSERKEIISIKVMNTTIARSGTEAAKVGLLATSGTVQTGIYGEALTKEGP